MISMFMNQMAVQLLALHQPCIKKLSSLSTYGLTGLEREISNLPTPWGAWHPLPFTFNAMEHFTWKMAVKRCVPVVCTL